MSQKQATSNLVLKRGADGKYVISLSDLQRCKVAVPSSVKNSDYSLVFIQGPDGNPRVGLSKDPITIRSVEDATRLYKLGEFASKMEDKAARDARVLKTQKVLYEQAADEKEQPNMLFHKQVIDNSASLEVLKTNMVSISACNAKENLDIKSKNVLLKYGEQVKNCLEKQVVDAAKNDINFSGSLKKYFSQVDVPEWIGRKLIVPLNPKPTSALKLLFPKDGNKGISLTKEEWQNPRILQELGPLLDYSRVIVKTIIPALEAFIDEDVKEIEKSQIMESVRIPILPVIPLAVLGGFRRSPSAFRYPKMALLERTVNSLMDLARVVFPPKERYAKVVLHELFHDPTWDYTKPENPISQVLTKEGQKLKMMSVFCNSQSIVRTLSKFNFPSGELKYLAKIIEATDLSDKDEQKVLEDYSPGSGPKIAETPYVSDVYVSRVLTPSVDASKDKFLEFKRDPRCVNLEVPKKKVTLTIRNTLYGKYSNELMRFLSNPKNPYVYIRDEVEVYLNQFILSEYRETAAQALLATFTSRNVPKATEFYDSEQKDFVKRYEEFTPPVDWSEEVADIEAALDD